MRETWHAAQSGNVFDLVRYWYVKGRPSRVEVASVSSDLQTLNGYSTYYLQYNWHGDVVVWVAPAGDGTNSITLTTDPWGVYSSDTFQYYLWNGAWGYLYFSPLKLYYVHGRWYNPETALWLSPDANGEYLYGSGQDAVNWSWRIPILFIRHHQPAQVNARVYYLNQIGNLRGTIQPNPDPDDLDGYIIFRVGQLVGPEKVKHISIFEGDTFWTRIQMFGEMFEFRTWSPKVADAIAGDLKINPLSLNERLVIIGNSGGGTVAVESLDLLQQKGIKANQVILRGSPVQELILRNVEQVDYITSNLDYYYSFDINPFDQVRVREHKIDFLGHVPPNATTNREIADLVVDLILR